MSLPFVHICAFTVRGALSQLSHSAGEAEAGWGDHATQAHVSPKTDVYKETEGAGDEGCGLLLKRGAAPRYP